MAEYLIVDGYNIMHAWESLKNTISRDLEHARILLVDTLANYRAVKGVNVIVVFDAHLVKGGTGSRDCVSGVSIIYTSEGETADSVIERISGEFGESDRITVATSDWNQQRLVFGRGAVRMSARELENEVKSIKAEITERIENNYDSDSDFKLRGHLKDNIREMLERMRRQK